MDEAKLGQELGHMFRRYWYWPITQTDSWLCHKCGALHHPPGGRPDILLLHPQQPALVCELKLFAAQSGENWEDVPAFPFSSIEDNQRRWLSMWNWDADAAAHDDCGAYLGLGTRHGTAGSTSNPRKVWLIPWSRWQSVELTITTAGQESLPLKAKKGMRREIQDNNLDAVSLLELFELEWVTRIGWTIRPGHPLQVPRLTRDLGVFAEQWNTVDI